MQTKRIVIWGAGKIGRGFVADLFAEAGYQITFVDASEQLIAQLRDRQHYTVVRAYDAERREDSVIRGYDALTTAQAEDVISAVTRADIVAIAVFPKVFDVVAEQLAAALHQRFEAKPDSTMDVLLCTNLPHAAGEFGKALLPRLVARDGQVEERVGLVETLVMRIAGDAPEDERLRDPLLVWTNGNAEFPVDGSALVGVAPDVAGLRLVEDMRAEEMRKLYTYNTCHAALAYWGAQFGHRLIVDCMADERVMHEVRGVLGECSLALQQEYGFSAVEMEAWVEKVLRQTNNPTLGDTVARFGGDPRRKLRRHDRLTGPFLLAVKHGSAAPFLARAIAAGIHYSEPNDEGASYVRGLVSEEGPGAAIRELCQFTEAEKDLARAVHKAYVRLPLEREWAELAEKADRLGFEHELTYHGCGQCVLAAILETLGEFDESAFRAATPLAGGLGMVGDASCSAILGASMTFGLLYPRRRENFGGDRENKYRTYRMAQELRRRAIDRYGSITCDDIHRRIMGRTFDLLDKEELAAFEAAGAHEDKCTGVVGLAARWAVEIIGEESIKDAVAAIDA
jgi:mannitol-1-phosphate 5-dehydrogenase